MENEMILSPKAEQIKERYLNNYVTDAQLLQYRDRVHAITNEEYDYIYSLKHPVEPVVETTETE